MQIEPMGVAHIYLGMEAQSGHCSQPALAALKKAYLREGGFKI